MSGYQQHSYDPNAYEQPGPPLKPYNWVQWTGVALGSIGVLLALVDLTGRLGWIDKPFDPGTGVIVALCAAGVILVNSRRQRRGDNSQGAK
jgi:hypothetical protein